MKTVSKHFFMFLSLFLLLGSMFFVYAENNNSALWSYEEYQYGDETGIVITSYNGSKRDIYVPAAITDGNHTYNVLKLGNEIFFDNDAIDSVTLSEGVKEIGSGAFSSCDNLKCVLFPESLEVIGENVLSDCPVLNSVILYDGLKSIGDGTFTSCPLITAWVNENTASYSYVVNNNISYEILNPNATPETVVLDGITYYIGNGKAQLMSADTSLTGEITIPTTVKGMAVTAIGPNAFEEVKNITKLTLPETISFIDTYAFSYCINLTEINIPYGVKAIKNGTFDHCEVLKAIDIPYSVSGIEKNAFYNCTSLESVSIPDGVTEISEYAFANCSQLKYVLLPSTLKRISKCAFSYAPIEYVEFPEGLEYIGEEAFRKCEISNLKFPKSLLEVGSTAFIGANIKSIDFNGCKATFGRQACSDILIEELTISPNNKFSIYGFIRCYSLKSLTFEDGVTSIAESLFEDCTALEKVIIPASVTEIKNAAFNGCKKAVLWVIDGSYAHNYAIQNNLPYYIMEIGNAEPYYKTVDDIEYLIVNSQATLINADAASGNVVIPDTMDGYPVTRISPNAFYQNYNVVSVHMPQTVQSIGDKAFYRCTNLETINIPNGIKTIEEETFYTCKVLKNTSLPDSVISIKARAFYYCNLLDVAIPQYIEYVGEDAFCSCSLSKVIIPKTVKEIYYFAFRYNPIKKITIMGDVTIKPYAFSNCTSLETLEFVNGVTTVIAAPFEDCTNLTAVIIPTTAYKYGTFTNCPNIIFCVKEGSNAQAFAESRDIPYYIMTDDTIPVPTEIDGVKYWADSEKVSIISCQTATKSVLEIPSHIDGKPVTKINRYAFNGATGFTQIILPYTITEIGDAAFYSSSLEKINIPIGITVIDDDLFENSNLKEIDLPYGLTTIISGAFRGCRSLKTIKLPSTLKTIDSQAFCYSGLETIEIPSNVYIGSNAFSSCYNLRYVKLPETLKTIHNQTFYYCKNLKEIELPEGLISIGLAAFSLSGLEKINIPSSVKYIGENAFNNTKLKNIVYPNVTIEYNSYSDNYHGLFCFIDTLESVIIPDSITSIPQNEFKNCPNIKNVVIPKSVTSIGDGAFSGCTDLILCVYEGSCAHRFAQQNNIPYFIIHKLDNDEISYGTPITGTVKYTDGISVSGATVELFYDDGSVKQSVTTDIDGNYRFTYCEVDTYTIKATDSLGAVGLENVAVKRMNTFDVYIAGQTDITLRKSYSVTGTVLPIGDVKVELLDETGKTIQTLSITDGNFVFNGVPNGSYVVKASNSIGHAICKINVFNKDLIIEDALILPEESAQITGVAKILNRDGIYSVREWIEVSLFDSNGNIFAKSKTNSNGVYSFTGIPLGNYALSAKTTEIRQNETLGYNYSALLEGYGSVYIENFEEYSLEDIVLQEKISSGITVSGKVTAQGGNQRCTVILSDHNGNEFDIHTGSNGKYVFYNVPDGHYVITATAHSTGGVGEARIVITNGVISGSTNIKIQKSDKLKQRETEFLALPEITTREEALACADLYAAEKEFYDSQSEQEKSELSQTYVSKLHTPIALISNLSITNTSDDIIIQNAESIISTQEILDGEEIKLSVGISMVESNKLDENGIVTNQDFIQHTIETCAAGKMLGQYYEITLTKTNSTGKQEITDISKDTNTTGSIRFTIPIPQEYLGHNRYFFVHVHNGQAVTLVDLDDNPNTITFETSKLSTFALCFDDVAREKDQQGSIEKIDGEKYIVSSSADAYFYLASYKDGKLISTKVFSIPAGTSEMEFPFDAALTTKGFLWDNNMTPLCESK